MSAHDFTAVWDCSWNTACITRPWALVISMVTLSLVLGGTAFAAATTTGDTKADTKLVKKLAPSLSVKHANSATNAIRRCFMKGSLLGRETL